MKKHLFTIINQERKAIGKEPMPKIFQDFFFIQDFDSINLILEKRLVFSIKNAKRLSTQLVSGKNTSINCFRNLFNEVKRTFFLIDKVYACKKEINSIKRDFIKDVITLFINNLDVENLIHNNKAKTPTLEEFCRSHTKDEILLTLYKRHPYSFSYVYLNIIENKKTLVYSKKMFDQAILDKFHGFNKDTIIHRLKLEFYAMRRGHYSNLLIPQAKRILRHTLPFKIDFKELIPEGLY